MHVSFHLLPSSLLMLVGCKKILTSRPTRWTELTLLTVAATSSYPLSLRLAVCSLSNLPDNNLFLSFTAKIIANISSSVKFGRRFATTAEDLLWDPCMLYFCQCGCKCKRKQWRQQTTSDWFIALSNWPSGGFLWLSLHLRTQQLNGNEYTG